MRLTSRRLLSFTAILVLAGVVLAGCGTEAPAAVPATAEAPATDVATTALKQRAGLAADADAGQNSATVNAAAARSTGEGPILNPDVSGEITLWHFWGSPVRYTAVRRVIALCQQKLPNIKVNDAVKPFGDIWTANLAAVAAGSGMPDVIVSDRRTLPQYAEDSVYMPLQDWADRDTATSTGGRCI